MTNQLNDSTMIPLILAVKSDACLWEMGDYLVEIAGQSSIETPTKIREVSAGLIAHGWEQYSVRYLNRLHWVASAFPPASRKAGVSWEIHATASTPATLRAVLKAAEVQS